MSYLVLAMGAFLSLCGALALYAGYGIIQVERGWATFIAGSVAFSCGIVTLALGLILHRLSSLFAPLKTRNEALPLPRELARRTPGEPRREPSPDFNPAAVPSMAAAPAPASGAAASLRSWAQRPPRSNLAAARKFLKSRGPVLPSARATSEPDFSSHEPPRSSGDDLDMPQTSLAPPEPGIPRPAEEGAAAKGPAAKEESTSAAASRPEPDEFAGSAGSEPGLFDEAKFQEAQEAPPREPHFSERGEPPREPEESSQMGVGWPAETTSVDRLFEEEILMELDAALEQRNEGEEPSSERVEPAGLNPAPPAVTPAVSDAAAEASRDLPPLPSGAGQEELAIVGQYESEGTSYVMYSDGSIEARTQHAVFHFKSMSELKSFLETQRQTSQESPNG